MATTYKLISSVTVGSGGAASIDFTSIPATYTDLVVKTSLRDTFASTVQVVNISFNGNTANFSNRNLQGNGSTASSFTQTRRILLASSASSTANTFSNGEIYIPNYAGATNKSFSSDSVSENNASTSFQALDASLWSNTAAITSITLSPDSGSFVQYSTAYLYGISNA
jgi:hypothetical protein